MKPTIKVTFVFNNTAWLSIEEKVKYVVDFFYPDFIIEPTIIHTNFASLPFVSVGTIDGIKNTPSSTNTVDQYWFNLNVSSLTRNADVVLFYVNTTNVPSMQTSVGIMQGKYDSVIQACIFGVNETDRAYQYINGEEVDQGNACAVFMAHEISHALYLIQEQPDNTHAYFYSGQATKVLDDLKNGKLTKLYQMLAYLKQAVLSLTLQINKQKIMNQPTLDKITQSFTPHPMVYKWAKAIELAEGNAPYLNNPGSLKVSPLTISWGAHNGVQATDGGWIAKFSNYNDGFQALCNFLTLGCHDELKAFHQSRTLGSFTKVYAGNPPSGYISTIIHELKASVDTNVSTFLS